MEIGFSVAFFPSIWPSWTLLKMCDNVQLCQQTIQARQHSIAHNHHVRMIATRIHIKKNLVSVFIGWGLFSAESKERMYIALFLGLIKEYSLHIVCRGWLDGTRNDENNTFMISSNRLLLKIYCHLKSRHSVVRIQHRLTYTKLTTFHGYHINRHMLLDIDIIDLSI